MTEGRSDHGTDDRVLRENEERLRLAVRAGNHGLYDLNVQTGECRITAEYALQLGYDPATFVETNDAWIERLHPDDRERCEQVYSDYLEGRLSEYRIEFRQRTADGGWKWILSAGSVAERDAEGRPLRMLGTHTDIDERKRAEEAVRESEQRYRNLFRTLLEGYAYCRLIYDENGVAVDFVYLDVNDMFEPLTGLPDVTGKRVTEVIPGIDETNPEIIRNYDAVVRTGTPTEFETYLPQLDRTLHVSAYTPQPEYFVAVFEDVSERRRNEGLLRGVIEGTPDAIYVKDPEGRYLLLNKGAAAILGKTVAEALGKDDVEILGPDGAAGMRTRDLEVLEAGRTITAEERLTRADVATQVFLSTRGPVYDPLGRVTGTFGVARDITERTMMEEEIRELNAELEQRVLERTEQLSAANEELTATNEELASVNEDLGTTNVELDEVNRRLDDATHAKSEFLASMSHELRTPLNSILGFSGILLQDMAGPLNDEQRKQIGMVSNAGQHLLALINDVLDLARIEAGAMQLGLTCFAPGDMAGQIVESLAPQAAERGLELVLDDRTDGADVCSDAVRFRQILLNLVGNALKFTSAGTVALALEMADDGGLRVTVTDTGPGIAPADLDQVFEEFYQVPRADGSKTVGTGLGLSVSRKIAALLKGTLTTHSAEGGGSVFELFLPDLTADGAPDAPGEPG